MKKTVLAIFFLALSTLATNSQDTFSICAVDTITGEAGSAGASCIGAPQIPQGCYILSDVIPGTGVIHTQAYYLAANQNYAHQLMLMGLPPQQIIDSLVANDAQNNPNYRQYGIVDLYGSGARTAAYTGINCDDYKNHIIGLNYTVQGNILLGQQILDSMEARFLNTEGELACKLMAALQGAKVIGADTRCLDDGVSSLSAFLRVAQPDDPSNDLYLDLNVPSTPDGIDPIDSLQTLMDAWGGCLASQTGHDNWDAKLMIYPNPAVGTIYIQFTEENQTGQTISIFNGLGKKVFSLDNREGKSISVDPGLDPGLYYILIEGWDKSVYRSKLIVH